MNVRRMMAIVVRQGYLMRGSVSRVLPLFAWVAVDIILWGYLTKYLNSIATPGFNFIPALLGAVLFWDFFMRVMQGITIAFFEDVWSRNFLNLFSTPLSIVDYLSGLILTSIITSAVGLVAMIVLASLTFGLSFFSYGVLIVPYMMNLFLFGISLGILACALVLRLGPSAEWFIWPIPALVSPFVGVLYPVSTLPGWMQVVARGLPPSYVFESMRAVVAHQPVSMSGLIWSTVLDAVYVVGAVWVFNRTYRYAVRVGLIARYSAESIA
jgi:ABC-2 type transport system permease protein